MSDPRAIGVFDSGVGGLTVLAALRRALPAESFVYLGDTARLPYGTKTPATVTRYARQAAAHLTRRGIKLLVIACNTASAVAVEALATELAPLPVIGVVEPGADAATRATRDGRIAVVGTEGTIAGGAYVRAIHRRRPDAVVTGRPCPLFVALAEEGWVEGTVPEAAAAAYLADLVGPQGDHDTLVLGCTHFPLLRPAIATVARPDVALVDSAETTAAAVARTIDDTGLAAPAVPPVGEGAATAATRAVSRLRFLATDGPERFARVGAGFLGLAFGPGDVEVVDL